MEQQEQTAEAQEESAEKKNTIKNKANKNLKKKRDDLIGEKHELMRDLMKSLQRLRETGQKTNKLEAEHTALNSAEDALRKMIIVLNKQKDDFLREEQKSRTSFNLQYQASVDQFKSLLTNFSAEYAELQKGNEKISRNSEKMIVEKKSIRARERRELEAWKRNIEQQLANSTTQSRKVQMQEFGLQKQKQNLSTELAAAQREESALRKKVTQEYEVKLMESDAKIAALEEAKKNLTTDNTKLKTNVNFQMELENSRRDKKLDGLETETEGLQDQNSVLMRVVNKLKTELHGRLMRGRGEDVVRPLSTPKSESQRRQEKLAKEVAQEVAWRKKRTAPVHQAAANSIPPEKHRWTPENDDGTDEVSKEMAASAAHHQKDPPDESDD